MSPGLLLLGSMIAAPPDVSVPPGFAITPYADNALAPDVYTMTIDDAGRVLVAGRGYARVLVDDGGDGVADRAIDLIDGLKDGPMGLLAEGDSLHVVTDGGLQHYHGYNGKDKVKQPPQTLVKLKTMGEHDAHAVRRGPDGWLYLLCGNSTGVKRETITSDRSPVKEPVAGTLLRISPDGTQVEVVADGFRNPYSFDFNLAGEPFTSDSDNERCVGLPWYEPCRFYHVVPGANYGWRSPQLGQFWRKPPYFIDCVPPTCCLGRGSPTGVACYRHGHFPEKYRGGFFLADWTFGRIHFVPLTESASTYVGKPEVFAEATGTSGFAVTALAVHPQTGELYVSIGGRGTRGGVYRISYEGSSPGKPLPMTTRSLDHDASAGKKWLTDCSWDGRSASVGSPATQRARRQALELILRHREKTSWGQALFDAIKPNLAFPDPLIGLAAARAVRGLAIKVADVRDLQAKLRLALVAVGEEPEWVTDVAVQTLRDRTTSPSLKLQAIRLLQLSYGDLTAPGTAGTLREGYTLRNPARKVVPDELKRLLRAMLFRKNQTPELDREVARTLAALGEAQDLVSTLTAQLRPDTWIEDDLHYLAVLGRVQGEWTKTDVRLVVEWLLDLEHKTVRDWITRDRDWPLRLEEMLETIGQAEPAIAEKLLDHRAFGRPEHLLFVKPLGASPAAAAKRFLAVAENDPTYAWTPGLVLLLDNLSLELTRPTLLKLWERPHLRDAILRVLSDGPASGDQPRFLVGLQSFDPEVVRLSAVALAKLEPPDGLLELAGAIKALRRLVPEDKHARGAVVALLQKRTGETIGADPKAWAEWSSRVHPEVATLLVASDGFNPVVWKKREAGMAWDKGDVVRGRTVFTKATCIACHDGGRAMGPSLLGVARRFSRDDLLTAILQPSKDVSPRYRPTRIATTDDKTYVGMIVYEATDGVLLQTNADTIVRIAGETIASKRPVELSMMPAGLLDTLTNVEIADLFAYLKSLDEPRTR